MGTYDTIHFIANDVSLLGLDSGSYFQKTWTLFQIPHTANEYRIDEGTLGLDNPIVHAGITLYYSFDAALTATLALDSGAVDINYDIAVPDFGPEQIVDDDHKFFYQDGTPYFLNTPVVWDTGSFGYTDTGGAPDLDPTAPNLANTFFSTDLSYDFAAGYKDAGASADFGIISFGINIPPYEINDGNPDGPANTNLIRISPGSPTPITSDIIPANALPSGNEFTFDGIVEGLEGYLRAPSFVPDTPGTDSEGNATGWGGIDQVAQDGHPGLPELVREGDGANFFNLDLHVFDFLAAYVPILAPLTFLKDSVGDDNASLSWNILDLFPHLGVQLSQEMRFVPTGVGVHIHTSDGQDVYGALGDEFNFDTSAPGAHDLTLTPEYTLYGYYENDTGIKINGGVNLTALSATLNVDLSVDLLFDSFGFTFNKTVGPVVNEELVSFSSDRIDLYNSKSLPVAFNTYTGAPLTLTYENFFSGSDGDDTIDLEDAPNQSNLPYPDLNASNGGNDTIYGNALDNKLNGGLDNDTIDGRGGSDLIVGGAGQDELHGGDNDDFIYGGFGDDVLYGDDGNDYLSTGELVFGDPGNIIRVAGGQDQLYGGDGNDWLSSLETDAFDILDGGDGVDKLTISRSGLIAGITASIADASTNTGITLPDGTVIRNIEQFAKFIGGFGNDKITGGDLDDELHGGAGNDELDGGKGNNILHGDAGDDTIAAAGGNDKITGGSGNDTLIGGFGSDIVLGDAGNDTIYYLPDGHPDTLMGGDGLDTLAYVVVDPAQSITFDLLSDDVLSDGTLIGGFERLQFGSLVPLSGDYELTGGNYNDNITTGSGNDIIKTNLGADVVFTAGGDDRVIIPADNPGRTFAARQLDGGTGTDTLVIETTANSVGWKLNFLAGPQQTLQNRTVITNFEKLEFYGQDNVVQSDAIKGGGFADVVEGGGGSDTLDGGGGVDLIDAGSGDDTVQVTWGEGGDTIHGGLGDDRLVLDFRAAFFGLDVHGIGSPTPTTLADGTTVDGFEYLTVRAGAGNDKLTGTSTNAHYTIVNGPGPFDIKVLVDDADFIDGGDGNDTIDGRGGHDRIYGGKGNDTIVYRPAVDGSQVGGDFIDGGEGDDTLLIDYTNGGPSVPVLLLEPEQVQFLDGSFGFKDRITVLADGTRIGRVEHVAGTGAKANGALNMGGGFGADEMLGSKFDDTLLGGGGDDILAGYAGKDHLDGGGGNDTATYFNGPTVPIGTTGGPPTGVTASLANPGINTGDAAGDTYVSIENLTGSMFSDTLYGDQFDNILRGDPEYKLEFPDGSAPDPSAPKSPHLATTSTPGGGNDALYGGGGNDKLFGGFGNDTLFGETGDDVLDGGIGADQMTGGIGDDWYFVDDSGDKVIEVPGGGNDTVFTTIDYTIKGGLEIEALVNLTPATGLKLTGNELANRIYGSNGDDRLQGRAGIDQLLGGGGNDRLDGGTEADSMKGGAGDDVYIVDDFADSVSENTGEGYDTVITSVGYKLQAGSEVERLRAATDAPGLILDGNELDNLIVGGNGADILSGGGGHDKLRGGDGDDIFKLSDSGFAIILDFQQGSDMLEIMAATFGHGLTPGGVAAVVNAATAPKASHSGHDGYFIFDNAGGAAGTLYWDATGGGGSDAVAVAKLNGLTSLAEGDFHIV